MKSCGVTIQIKPCQQYFHMVLFIFKYFTKCNLGFVLNFDFKHWNAKVADFKSKQSLCPYLSHLNVSTHLVRTCAQEERADLDANYSVKYNLYPSLICSFKFSLLIIPWTKETVYTSTRTWIQARSLTSLCRNKWAWSNITYMQVFYTVK